ncbi:MAG: hypothetical protein HC923_02890 [Myxococcales bacterium]|nr:hypothetical protein [Myxococcales bacterium]
MKAAGGQTRSYLELRGEALDLVDLALRFALIEVVVQKTRVPLLVDDVGVRFPERRRKLYVQMLQHLAQLTQVILLTELDDVPGPRVQAESLS